MPALGVAQQTGKLLKWLKTDGQTVTKGEPLMEIETDKATVEIEAAASGILTQVSAKPGDEVPVGQTIAWILAPGETTVRAGKSPPPLLEQEGTFIPPAPSKAVTAPHLRSHPSGESEVEAASAASTQAAQVKPVAQSNPPISAVVKRGSKGDFATRILASPKAKRIAKERGIDLRTLRGSGPDGSVLAADVLGTRAEALEAFFSTATPLETRIIPLTQMRRIVGQRMTQSKQSAPHFYISMDVDMSAVGKLRSQWKERGDGSVPSINDFILQATAHALKEFPSMNSSFTEQGIQQHADINIGVAVALAGGLVVPVIRNADRQSLLELAKQSHDLADRAQSKKLIPLDYEGGTFTVSNLGMLGVDSFTAIINPPQAAILAVGRVAPRVVTDGDGIEIKPMMTATLSADHRVVDGAAAARFLGVIKTGLENIRY